MGAQQLRTARAEHLESRERVRAQLRPAREAGDLKLVSILRRLDVAAEGILRARGEFPAAHARHYSDELKAAAKGEAGDRGA
jgi:hypothetical protein